VRPRLEALPILDSKTFSPRSVVSALLAISEPSSLDETTIGTALDRISDDELAKYTKPKEITSVSEAQAYMANIETQSTEYTWRRNGQHIFLLAGSEQAKVLGVPGVVFEFMGRMHLDGLSTRYQIPTNCSSILSTSTATS
jgi:hypothetical protein